MIDITGEYGHRPRTVTDNGAMTTSDDIVTPPLGARLLPGVDLALWSSLTMLILLVVVAGALTAWALIG